VDTSAVSARLIGAMFVEKGLITEEQLQSALEEQRAGGGRLGEILVERFGISRLDLASALAEQWAEYEQPGGDERPPTLQAEEAGEEPESTPAVKPEPQPVPEAEPRRPIGEIFLERGLLTAAQLDAALQEQRETGQRLGEVLVAKGVVSRLELASALADQWSTLQKLRPPEPAVEPEPGSEAPAVAPAPAVEELEDLRISLDGLATRLEVGERRLAGVTAALAGVEALRQQVEAFAAPSGVDVVDPAAVASLDERVEELARAVAALPAPDETAAPFRSALDALAARLESLDRERDHERALLERVEALEARPEEPAWLAELRDAVVSLAGVEARSDELAAGIDALRAAVAELARRQEDRPPLDPDAILGPVEARLAAVEGRLSEAAAAEGRLRDTLEPLVREAVDRLAHDQQALHARLDEAGRLAGALEQTAARVELVEQRLAAGEALEGRLREELERRVEETAEAVRAEQQALAIRLDEATSRAGETAAGAAELRTTLTELSGRVDGLAGAGDAVERLAAQVFERERHLEQRLRERLEDGLAGARGPLDAALADQARRLEAAEAHAAKLEHLGGRIEELDGRLAALTDVRSEPDSAGEEQLARLRQLEERVRGELDRELRMFEDRMGGRLEQVSSDASGELEQRLAGRLAELEISVRAQLAEQAGRLADLQRPSEPTAQLHASLTELDGRLAAAATGARVELDALREQQAGELRSLEERLRVELSRSLGDRHEGVSGADAARLAAELVGLEERLAVAGTEVAGRLGGLEELVGRLGERLDEADASVRELRVAADERGMSAGQAAEELERVRGELAGVEERLRGVVQEAEQRLGQMGGELAGRLDAVEQRAAGLEGVDERLGRLGERLDEADASVRELRVAADERGMSAGQAAEALERVRGELAGVEERLRGVVQEAEQRLGQMGGELAGRLEAVEQRAAGLESVEERLGGLGERLDEADVSTHELRTALDQQGSAEARAAEAVAQVRGELAGLEERLRGLVQEAEQRLTGAGGELGGRVRGLEELGDRLRERLDDADASVRELRDAEERRVASAGQAAEAIERVRGELDATEERLRGFVREAEQRLAQSGGELAGRVEAVERQAAGLDAVEERLGRLDGRVEDVDASGAAARAALAEQLDALDARLGAGLAEVAESLRAAQADGQRRVEEATGDLAGRLVNVEQALAESESLRGELARLDERLAELTAGAELDRVRDELRTAVEELTARIGDAREEALGAARSSTEEVEGLRNRQDRHEDVAREREAMLVAARGELAALAERLAALEDHPLEAVEAALAGARAEVGRLAARVEQAERRADDADAALAAALTGLDARVEDGVVRATEQTAQLERALREELGSLAATLEERDAAAIDARGELHDELERASASLGWRVERLEQALAADDTGELRELVASLAERLERQSALADEQVRVTERALRKGLASLGARLVESEGAYVEAGDALRRSIERLGRVVSDADRAADAGRPVDERSHLAFVPTGEGYRLAELDGRAPDVGADVDVPGVEGSLRVTRVSRSPLPLDSRSCVFLERVTPPAG
jgi:DNA repair exonuclease SbcCD ATPase subunit